MELGQDNHLTSTWAVTQAAGEQCAVVRVKKLQVLVSAPEDAWGRSGRTQPALVSVECSFRERFATTASNDRLGADTVHYGNLAKAVLASLDVSDPKTSSDGPGKYFGLRGVLDFVWYGLTGRLVNGREGNPAWDKKPPFLSLDSVRFLSVSVCLPKASSLGEGVSLTASSTFGPSGPGLPPFGMALRLLRLRVPTLIGVNPNERMARQMVVATVEIDKMNDARDLYKSVEDCCLKVMASSHFETLEALGLEMANSILSMRKEVQVGEMPWKVRIRLEKPIAVPLAECPEVEVQVGSSD